MTTMPNDHPSLLDAEVLEAARAIAAGRGLNPDECSDGQLAVWKLDARSVLALRRHPQPVGVSRKLFNAVGNIVSTCADQRDVFPDAPTALAFITDTINELYACMEDGLFGALQPCQPVGREIDGLR